MTMTGNEMHATGGRSIRTLMALTLLVGACVSAGCSERRELPMEPPLPDTGFTYEADIKPIFDAQCVSCHNANFAQGNYDVSTYAEVLGNGSDATPNAIAGDPQSLLVVLSLPGNQANNMNSFYSSQSEVEIVRRWVVEDDLAEE